jgi:hypothetical protein
MWRPLALKAGDQLIPLHHIKRIDIGSIEHAEVDIVTNDGETFKAMGFDAIEAIWAFKPSAVEGRRLKWKKGAWAFHNIVGHPLMQFLAWVGLTRLAVVLHDATTPVPRAFR